MAPHRNLQRKLLLVKLLQNSRRRRKEMQQKILFLLTVRRMLSGADPGVFLGGGALVSCSTSTPINYIVFFFSCTLPLDPPLVIIRSFFLSALLISSEKTTADRPCRRLPRNKGWFEEVWNTYTDQRFKKTFRVSKATFNFIIGRMQHDCDDTDSTSPIASSSSSSSCSL